MPPAPRDYSPGLHHVWVNATGKEAYFVDEVDRLDWIRQLVRALEIHNWSCVAFAQLTTHVHTILDVPDWSLPQGMKRLNQGYSTAFNERYERHGQFVRRRYGNRRIESGSDLVGAFAYVVLNPVKAGLAPRSEDWRWSSYATTLGISDDYPFLDTSSVLAEGGGVESLRATVEGQYERYLAQLATSGV
jgi:putative transposase